MSISTDHIAALVEIVGRDHALTARDLATRDPGIDPHNFGADLLVRPKTTAEVADVLRLCHTARIGVVPQGGRTGISGGAVSHAGEIILSLERLNAIESLDPISRTAVVQAGVTLGALMQACQPHHLSPAIDLGARDSATLGGLTSTNAGGSQAFRFGTMRDRLLGLEVVLADGTVITELGQVRKRNEGLALEQLFIGAEGILGVITRVSIALVDEDGPLAAALIGVPSLSAAVTLTDQLQRTTDLRLSALELMSGNHAHISSHALGFTEFSQLCTHPYVLLIEVTAPNAHAAEESLVNALAGPLESGLIADAVIAQNEQQRRAMWQVREDWSVDRQRPGGLWYDVSVPIAHLAPYLERFSSQLMQHDAHLSIFVVGHLADGNIHITVNAPQPISERYEEIATLVTATLRDIGGSFSAEHGIGLEKKATLVRELGSAKQTQMHRLKDLLDPHGIMNPGKVL